MSQRFHVQAFIKNASMANASPDVHTIEAIVASTMVNANFMRMDRDTTLANFVSALSKGTQLLCCHNISNGFGLSRDGRLVDEDDESLAVGIFDIERGLPLNPPATYADSDAYIRRIENGKIRELSIGANGGRLICDICGLDMWNDWNCIHYLGRTYTIEDETGKHDVVATALVKDAFLVEVSLVPRGADESAVVLRNRLEAHLQHGYVSEEEANEIRRGFSPAESPSDTVGAGTNALFRKQSNESQRMLLKPGQGHQVLVPQHGNTNALSEVDVMSASGEEDNMSKTNNEHDDQRISILEKRELEEWTDKQVGVLERQVEKLQEENAALTQTINQMRPLADIGEQARRTLKAETVDIYRAVVAISMSNQNEMIAAIQECEESLKDMTYSGILAHKSNYQQLLRRYQQLESRLASVASEDKTAKAYNDVPNARGFRQHLVDNEGEIVLSNDDEQQPMPAGQQPMPAGQQPMPAGQQTLPASQLKQAHSSPESIDDRRVRASAYELRF